MLISASNLAQGDQQQLNYLIDFDIKTRKGHQSLAVKQLGILSC